MDVLETIIKLFSRLYQAVTGILVDRVGSNFKKSMFKISNLLTREHCVVDGYIEKCCFIKKRNSY